MPNYLRSASTYLSESGANEGRENCPSSVKFVFIQPAIPSIGNSLFAIECKLLQRIKVRQFDMQTVFYAHSLFQGVFTSCQDKFLKKVHYGVQHLYNIL